MNIILNVDVQYYFNYLFSYNIKPSFYELTNTNLNFTGRKETMSKTNTDSVSLGSTKPTSFSQSRKNVYDGILAQIDDSKKALVSKNMKKKSRQGQAEKIDVIDLKNKYGSQAADVSGVTSAKDPTSTKTSGDRLKQPIPSKGRKELINFVHEAMQVPNHKGESASIPVSHRKRVTVPMGKVDRRGLMPTPMPLHPGGIPFLTNYGLFKSASILYCFIMLSFISFLSCTWYQTKIYLQKLEKWRGKALVLELKVFELQRFSALLKFDVNCCCVRLIPQLTGKLDIVSRYYSNLITKAASLMSGLQVLLYSI